jgi:crotonobetainyl-CoA:carnitine CoA-transferase CaiB-like acyl-CoA transferase
MFALVEGRLSRLVFRGKPSCEAACSQFLQASSEWSDYWGAVQQVPDRSGGEYRLPGRPWRFSAESLPPAGTPAFQGEHNVEVFRELGVSEEELRRLADSGVLVAHPRATAS